MKPKSRTLLLSATFLPSALAAIFVIAGGSSVRLRTGSTAAASSTGTTIADEPLVDFQNELLELAFETATALPIEPHIKSRSKAQEAVVTTCLELDQPLRALGYIERIENWRRGACYADLAFYCARRGHVAGVQPYLDVALRISEEPEDVIGQAWRRDRIRAAIAKTHLWLGDGQGAAPFEAGLAPSESGQVQAVKAMLADEDALEEQLTALDGVLATGDFDQVKNTLETLAQLFDRFYADEGRRGRLEGKIKSSWSKLPVMVRIEVTMELTEFALHHGDRDKALELVEEARLFVEGSRWMPEDRIALTGRLAGLRFRAGDEEEARSEVDAASAMFDTVRNEIGNICRAGALRPVAEAYQTMGDTATALAVYGKAVEEGVVNPNSRPRAEDLSATCRSMASHKVEPDAELRARMRQIYEELGDPW